MANYFIEIEPRNYQAEEANREPVIQSELLNFSRTDNIDCNIVNLATNTGDDTNQLELDDRFWFLYFMVLKPKRDQGHVAS